jgi:large subunit ribosomal protein L30e
MDIQRALRSAVSTGKVHLGTAQAVKAVKSGEARLVIIAEGTPASDTLRTTAEKKGVPTYDFGGRGTELGPACGKPFPVGVLTVLDAGESDILQLSR